MAEVADFHACVFTAVGAIGVYFQSTAIFLGRTIELTNESDRAMVASCFQRIIHMAEAGDEALTPQEMRDWLRQELRDLTKAMELRVNDATDFVTAYSNEQLTAQQTMQRFHTYSTRWGDAIRGVRTDAELKDTEILARLDRARSSGPARER
jgi:hypothetical protein